MLPAVSIPSRASCCCSSLSRSTVRTASFNRATTGVGRAGGREQALPGDHVVARIAGLGHRGQLRRTPGSGLAPVTASARSFAGADRRATTSRCCRTSACTCPPSRSVIARARRPCRGRAPALISAGLRMNISPAQMLRGAIAARGKDELVRALLARVVDQLSHECEPAVDGFTTTTLGIVTSDEIGAKSFTGSYARLRVEAWIDAVRRHRSEQQRVAVSGRLRYDVGTDAAACSRPIVDDDLLTETSRSAFARPAGRRDPPCRRAGTAQSDGLACLDRPHVRLPRRQPQESATRQQ